MINRQQLLSDLQKLLARLEADLLERSESSDVPEVGKTLRAEYERAKGAERTAQNYVDWRTDAITQAAAAWVLSCVFVRFLEDNRLIDPPKIAGPPGAAGDGRLERARDEYELYFREHPKETDREYLLAIFDELAKLPGTKDVFGEHNPVRELPNWLSGDAAGELLGFFQKIDANTGTLIHDFTDTNWDTRFLGDLYQDLSPAARKKYALLQTPEFVEEFILDRTLNPALDEFGLTPGATLANGQQPTADGLFRMIDPACGSGHFLLGAFPRILDRWQRKEPGTNVRELVQRSLNSIYGVDVNPYAVAIARFRMLLAAMQVCSLTRLADAPGFQINLVCGDSLLHGVGEQKSFGWRDVDHATQAEDMMELRRILRPDHYHTVVANPPYITPKDRALASAYRERFSTCFGHYQLVVPFVERAFLLAVRGTAQPDAAAYVGLIIANAFTRASFGQRLVERYLSALDVTHVIDTSGAYIPGHGTPNGTPTIILFARNRGPTSMVVRTLIGKRSEPGTPERLDNGKVWTSIVELLNRPGESTDFIDSIDTPRSRFSNQPWPLATDETQMLKDRLARSSATTLKNAVSAIGRSTHTGEDDAFIFPVAAARTRGIYKKCVLIVEGEDVRDWRISSRQMSLFPYDLSSGADRNELTIQESQHFWYCRTILQARQDYGQTPEQRGLRWFDQSMFFPDRYQTSNACTFAFTATHNHFSAVQGRAIFKQTAPLVLIRSGGNETLWRVMTVLNSSVACFWMRQHAFPRGGFIDGKWQERFNFNNFSIESIPLPEGNGSEHVVQLCKLAKEIDQQWEQMGSKILSGSSNVVLEAKDSLVALRDVMIGLQEELDWECYRLFGLIEDDLTLRAPPSIRLGQRAFEIVLARKMAVGEVQTTWFERHGSTPNTKLPDHWPDDYKQIVERRIDAIETNLNVALLEQPEYKRRWNTEPWESKLERALREWLLARLESYFDFDGRMNDAGQPTAKLDISLVSVAKLADIARLDAEFQQVGELYRNDPAFDVQALVAELVVAESVPLLPKLRYKPSGLGKRAEWEKTWELQRREDAGEDVGKIDVPPKYTSADFISTGGARYWPLRGKLDVPKERWISFPHCEGPDGTPVICWAGYDHLQQAKAISAYYVRVQTEIGGTDDARLIPLLACLIELLPWLKQWHNEPDASYDGLAMGDYFEGFINEEARQLNKTIPEIKAWTPPARAGGRRHTTASK